MSDTMKTARMMLRLDAALDERIRRAAELSGASLSEFVTEAASQAAERALADRRRFALDPAQWDAFVAALDAPDRDLPGLAAADAAWRRHFSARA